MATDMTGAKTILAQLGGRRFIAMTGASQFGGTADPISLKFTLPGRTISKVVITLDPSDTYVPGNMDDPQGTRYFVTVPWRCLRRRPARCFYAGH